MDLKNIIISEFRKVVSKAQERFAKQLGTSPDNIQIVLGLNNDNSPKYMLYKEYKPLRPLTINEVLGVKIDFLGKAPMVEMFLGKLLPKVCAQNEIPSSQFRLLCIQKDNVQYVWLANGSKMEKELQLDELITTEELMPQ